MKTTTVFQVATPIPEMLVQDARARIDAVVKSAENYDRCGYPTRIRQYEAHKQRLNEMALTPAEYDTAILRLAKVLGI